MKTRMYFLAGLFALIFLAPSCKQENDVEQASLSLSTQSLQFEKAVSEQSVTVETNQDKWSFIQSGDWFTVAQSATGLTVTVSENSLGTDRKGSVVVLAGGLAEKVDVMQSGSDLILSSIPGKLDFGNAEDKQRVEVVSNNSDYEVSVEDNAKEWLSIERVVGTKSFYVHVKANKHVAKRKGVVYVKSGKSIEEVSITQEGQFLFPSFINAATIGDIITFETNRGSVLIGQPDGKINPSQYTFELTGGLTKIFVYDFPVGSPNYISALTGIDEKLYKSEEVQSYLKEMGFVPTEESTADNPIFLNEELSVKLIVKFDRGLAMLIYAVIPKQPKAYPTFSQFPYTKVDFINSAHTEDVLKWEESQNSTIFFEEGGFKMFEVDKAKAKDGLQYRGYIVNTEADGVSEEELGLVVQESAYYKDVNLALWYYGNQPMLTEEFTELLLNEGFKFTFKTKDGYYYGKDTPERILYIVVGASEYTEINNGSLTLTIFFFAVPKMHGAPRLTPADQILLKPSEWNKRVEEVTKYLKKGPLK